MEVFNLEPEITTISDPGVGISGVDHDILGILSVDTPMLASEWKKPGLLLKQAGFSYIPPLNSFYNLLYLFVPVAKETEFELWGFIFVMMAAVMSGFRWTMTQILLQKDSYGLKNPLTLMSYVTPVMALSTALFSLIFDPWDEFRTNNYFNSSWHVTRSCLLMLLGGTLAFFMVLTEFILVSVTSAVTVTIAGVVKEAVTILNRSTRKD